MKKKGNRTKSRKRRKRNHVKPEDLWDVIDGLIDTSKVNAISRYPALGLSKNDLIHAVVGNFISDIVRNCRPQPILFRRWVNNEKISMNMILNSMGDIGIVIGAAAFRLAEQLEYELPDNGIESTANFVVPVIDGDFRDDMASVESSVAGCYLNYFLQDDRAMFSHKAYLAKFLKQKYEDDTNQTGCKVVDELMVMEIFCSSISAEIFCCLKSLLDNEPIVEITEELLQTARSYKQRLEELPEDPTTDKDEISRAWFDVISCIHGCETILELLVNKAA